MNATSAQHTLYTAHCSLAIALALPSLEAITARTAEQAKRKQAKRKLELFPLDATGKRSGSYSGRNLSRQQAKHSLDEDSSSLSCEAKQHSFDKTDEAP